MKIKGAFPIRWAASDGKDGQDGKPGPPGQDGKPGHDGSTARIIYAESFVMPFTPTGSTPAGWSTQPPQQPQVDVSFSGEWSPMDDGSLLAPQPAAGTTTTCCLRIATTEAAQTVHVGVWSKTNAIVIVGNIDKPISITGYALYIPPSPDKEKYNGVAITVPTAGVHTLYLRLIESPTPLDGRKARVRVGNRHVWLSSSLTYNDAGQPLTWTAPTLFREGTRATYANERRGNLLLNTAFVSTQMGKWDIAAGNTTDGINGINAYKGTNDPAATAAKDMLRQQIQAIQPNRWYTLSFYAKTTTEGSKVWSFVFPSCCDTTAGMVVDGVQKGASPSDASVLWTLTETFVRHSVTFKTKSAINAAQYVLFRLPADSKDCIICMPKLEEGTQATEWTTHADDTADIAAERTGFPWDNGLWNETKVYKWDDTRRDFVNYEFDKTFYKFGVKRKGMVIPKGTPPASAQGDSNWEVAHKIQTLVTDTIFGANANIGGFMATNSQLQSKNGSLTLDGIKGLIYLAHEGGYVWRVQQDGVQVLGDIDGKHIELDPSQKEIRIYKDKDTAVANLSGNNFSDISKIFGSSAAAFNVTMGAYTKTIERPGEPTTESITYQIATADTTSPARLSFDGTLLVDANTVMTDGIGMVDDQGRYWFPNLAALRMYVVTTETENSISAIATRDIITLESRGKNDKSTVLKGVFVDVPAGFHRIYMEYTLGVINTLPSRNAYAKIDWEIISISYVSDFYVSRLFGNGFAYGSSANNYIAAINQGGKMRHKMVSGNCGYDIYNGTIEVMLGGTWYTLSRRESDGAVLLT